MAQRQETEDKKFLETVVGPRLRAARHARGLSQAQLGHRVGVVASRISHWESGDEGPSQRRLAQLATALETSVDYLCGRTDTRNEMEVIELPSVATAPQNESTQSDGRGDTPMSESLDPPVWLDRLTRAEVEYAEAAKIEARAREEQAQAARERARCIADLVALVSRSHDRRRDAGAVAGEA
jgi:transcriptional regulator with XRE-family HTH domain